jgi:hypothetical protein
MKLTLTRFRPGLSYRLIGMQYGVFIALEFTPEERKVIEHKFLHRYPVYGRMGDHRDPITHLCIRTCRVRDFIDRNTGHSWGYPFHLFSGLERAELLIRYHCHQLAKRIGTTLIEADEPTVAEREPEPQPEPEAAEPTEPTEPAEPVEPPPYVHQAIEPQYLQERYDSAVRLWQSTTEVRATALETIADDVSGTFPDYLQPVIRANVVEILGRERFFTDIEPIGWSFVGIPEQLKGPNHKLLLATGINTETLAHQYETEETVGLTRYYHEHREWIAHRTAECLTSIFRDLASHAPADQDGMLMATVGELAREPHRLIDDLNGTLGRPHYADYRVLDRLRAKVRSSCAVGAESKPHIDRPQSVRVTEKDKTLPTTELLWKYLGSTPFNRLLGTPAPLEIPLKTRMSHCHLLGGSGSGKTSLIEKFFLHDIHLPEQPSIVILDPHSDLVRRIAQADLGLEDRLLLIDPRSRYSLAMNPFAVSSDRMDAYDDVTREQMTAGVIQTLLYLFSGFGFEMTAKQQTFFEYCIRALLMLPAVEGRNATIIDMLALMTDLTPIVNVLPHLPPIQREFFEREYVAGKGPQFRETREQVRTRLMSVVANPTLERLFSAPERKLDLFTELNRPGRIILVDAARDFLKDGSSLFGRLFLSLVYQAVMERAAIAEDKRHPTLLVVDEAASFFGDSTTESFLVDTRKFLCGCTFSHQHFEQANPQLRTSLAKNTAIKLHSTGPLRFSCVVDGRTPVNIEVEPGPLSSVPRMSDERYASFLERNRARVSMTATESQALPRHVAAAEPDAPAFISPPRPEDISGKW